MIGLKVDTLNMKVQQYVDYVGILNYYNYILLFMNKTYYQNIIWIYLCEPFIGGASMVALVGTFPPCSLIGHPVGPPSRHGLIIMSIDV